MLNHLLEFLVNFKNRMFNIRFSTKQDFVSIVYMLTGRKCPSPTRKKNAADGLWRTGDPDVSCCRLERCVQSPVENLSGSGKIRFYMERYFEDSVLSITGC